MYNMGMFCKHSPNLVIGLGHPPVQLHPVLLLQGDPLPGTGILLLQLFVSLLRFISIIVLENRIAGLLILILVHFIMS